MIAMNADRVFFFLVLCFTCGSSNDVQSSCEEYSHQTHCQTQQFNASPGSSVLLPCIFSKNWTVKVSWTHIPEVRLIDLTSKGLIKFLDPRSGRVKAFPNQGSEGNFSIRIDGIKDTDMGCYRCRQGDDCFQVELVSHPESKPGEGLLLLLYICGGVALILMIVAGGYCFKYILPWNKRAQNYSVNTVGAATEAGASAPPLETGRGPADNPMRGADNLVYENDDQGLSHQQGNPTGYRHNLPGVPFDLSAAQHTQSASGIYPNLSEFQFERVESQRTKMRFHTELFSRLRQSRFSRHFYVNQREINRQQAMAATAENHGRGGLGMKRVQDNGECKNPIYNRSTDQLNRL